MKHNIISYIDAKLILNLSSLSFYIDMSYIDMQLQLGCIEGADHLSVPNFT